MKKIKKHIKIMLGLVIMITALVFTSCQHAKVSEVYLRPEKMPQFVGGDQALADYLSTIEYPQWAKDKKIQGKVFIQFVVDETGQVTDAKVLRGLTGDCNQVVLKKVAAMPKWSPGEDKGKPVKTMLVLPVQFKLS